MAEMPVDQWIGDAAVVDLTHLGDNGEVTAQDLESRAGHVRAGDIVLLRTDWPRRVDVSSERFWRDAPWTGRPACEWLVARRVKAVGYDYPPDYSIRTSIFTPDAPRSRAECPTHDVFFNAGVTVIEYLTNLDRIGAPRCRFVALPLAMEGADGSPVRAIAMVEIAQRTRGRKAPALRFRLRRNRWQYDCCPFQGGPQTMRFRSFAGCSRAALPWTSGRQTSSSTLRAAASWSMSRRSWP